MIDFLYKSTLSLLVLLVVYHLVLERQKIHKFNRFYLLFSLVFSLVLPFINIEIVTETIVTKVQTGNHFATKVMAQNTEIIEIPYNYKPLLFWSLYGIIALFFAFRFIRNITNILSKVFSNEVMTYKNAKLVLLKEKTSPHTFLNYIFLNQADYQNRIIEEELYKHELIHVTQKHTLDILWIETLKTVFWFNPIFIFYKKAIQLNHEFLADENVVNSFNNVVFYQNLLLAHVNGNLISELTSNINYSITKKRFIMMTKTVSKTRMLISKIMVLPVLAGLFFLVCVKGIAQHKTVTQKSELNNTVAEAAEVKATSVWAVTTAKNENVPIKEPELRSKFEYNLEGLKIDPAVLQSSMSKLTNYITSNYISPSGVVKDQEVILIKFFLNKGGEITDIVSVPNSGEKPETELLRLLKSSPKSFFENNTDKVLVRIYFWPKEIEERTRKQTSSGSKIVARGYFSIPGTVPLHEVTVKPEFLGQREELEKEISKQCQDLKDLPNGKFLIGFAIEEDGLLSSFTPITVVNSEVYDKVIQILKDTKWKPGEKDGKAVKTSYVLQNSVFIEQ